MDINAIAVPIGHLMAQLSAVGQWFEPAAAVASLGLLAVAWYPALRDWRGLALAAMALFLLAGETILAWFHWNLYTLAVVVVPDTGRVAGHVSVPLWVESENLYFWALLVALLGVAMRRQRTQLLPGVMTAVAMLTSASMYWGKPFTAPLPGFFNQYGQYLQAMASRNQAFMQPAYQGMEGARQGYYNAWFMWVHPPLLFFSYACFTISFVALVLMVLNRHSSFETTAYGWAKLGYVAMTAAMLLGLPWALMSWQGESWWWSGKVNMSIMMWVLYTAYLHARLYLRRASMWRWVAYLGMLSYLILVLTYVTGYVVPGAHSYAASAMLPGTMPALAALPGSLGAVAHQLFAALASALGGGA